MLPLLDLAGCARERGRANGEALRETIERTLDLWERHTGSAAGSGAAGDSTAHLEAAKRWTPGAVEEMRGIAEGANTPFAAIFELNLADERRVFGSAGHCSSIGLRRGSHAIPRSGQTMDTPEWFADLRVVVRAAEEETGLTTLAFTIAGTLALCGINSAGVSVWCNALYQLASSPRGVPVSCLVSHLLSSRTLGEAKAFVVAAPHASGQHYLLGGPEGVVSLECSGRSVVEARADGIAVWHTNHPVANADVLDPVASESSLRRDAFIAEALTGASSTDDLCAILADRTVPVCKRGVGGGDAYTLWAVVAEHSSPPRVLASAGPPGDEGWAQVELSMFNPDRTIIRCADPRSYYPGP